MKGARILQLVLLILLIIYLVLFDNANPDPVQLPLLILLLPMRAVLVVAGALVLGWLIAWIPNRARLWGRGRELRKLRQRVEALEAQLEPEPPLERHTPVIPDREPHPVIPDRAPYDDSYDDESESA